MILLCFAKPLHSVRLLSAIAGACLHCLEMCLFQHAMEMVALYDQVVFKIWTSTPAVYGGECVVVHSVYISNVPSLCMIKFEADHLALNWADCSN